MDLIYAARYTEICDYAWHDYATQNNVSHLTLPEGIWHVDTAAIPQFFSTITNMFNRNRRYVVVSPSCDFGVCVQKYNPPALDLEKWVGLQMTPDHGYNGLKMQPRVNLKRCNPTDTYSIKCWSWTEATFDKIPDNVLHWFMVNCQIYDERVTSIPFGIAGNKNSLAQALRIDTYRNIGDDPPRDKLLYVNFQFYTTDRYRLYKHFDQKFYENVVTCKQGVPFDEYLNDLATHQFVLCPPGNGVDCYRMLETIYMGAIPVIQALPYCYTPYYDTDYPRIVLDSLYQFDTTLMSDVYHRMMNQLIVNTNMLYWPYWKNRILEWRSQL